ncbi:MAG: FtsQ-type POTRA domain-containing protein [Clostridiales bacterium]|nr:FtsQ-type POTRA domain-containing protein [Clostridiales bacterium]
MPREGRPMQRRRKKRRNPIISILSALLICGALLLGISVFFKISVIRAEGSLKYSQEQVISASGIKIGDNLFFVNKFNAISKIFKSLPYIDEATISKDLPNVLVIRVTDARPVAYVRSGENYWLMDKSCKLLEKVSSDAITGVSIIGLTPIQPVAGQKLEPGEAEKPKVSYIETVMEEILERDMLSEVGHIDITSVGDLHFEYKGRFRVKVGKNENISDKFDQLSNSLGYLSPVATGTIDLTGSKEARFIPD